MDNEQLYAAAAPKMRAGDIVVCECAPGDLVGTIIQLRTRSRLTHAAGVCDPVQGGLDVVETESTIGGGVSGAQRHPLGSMLRLEYSNGRAWLLTLAPSTRARMDLQKFYAAVGACEGTVRYDAGGLVDYLLSLRAPENRKRMFCSAYQSFLMEADGVLDPPGESFDPREESPQALADLPLFGECIQIWGSPMAIRWGKAADA
jgi:hypothetical protein